MNNPDWWFPWLGGGLAGAVLTQVVVSIVRWWLRPVLAIIFDAATGFGCDVATGRTFAKNVNLNVTCIEYWPPAKAAQQFEEEVFDLKLASAENASSFNVAAGGHRFLDLVHVEKGPSGIGLSFDFVVMAPRPARMCYKEGTYEMAVFASAENAASVSARLGWSWDGSVRGLRIDGFSTPWAPRQGRAQQRLWARGYTGTETRRSSAAR